MNAGVGATHPSVAPAKGYDIQNRTVFDAEGRQ